MRILLLLLFMGVGFANAQYSPTTSKVRFVYGIAFRTGDTANFKTAVDTNIVVMHLDSSLYYRNKGVFKAIGGSTAAYKLIADTLFNNGYTTRVRDRWGLDSLGALKLNVSDTATMLARGWLSNRSLDTATALQSRIQSKLTKSDADSYYPSISRFSDTATNLQTRIQTKQPLLGFTPENAANKNANNGYAGLDAGGKVPFSLLPAALMIYKGTWNVSTNSPTLSDGTGVSGWVYIVSTGGTVNTGSGSITYSAGDYAIHNGSVWQRSVGTNNVSSVNGQQGVVSLSTSNISEGSNLYWTAARSRAAQSLTTSGASGAATYDNTTGVLNIPTYTLAGLGGQAQLNGTGFVKATGTTISYDNSTYLTSFTETDPTVYAWAKAATKPSYAASEITSGAALSLVDDANVQISQSGSTTALLGAKTLTLGWTGQLSVARGGTGQSTLGGVQSWLGLGSMAYASTGSFVDLSSNQTKAGTLTLSNILTANSGDAATSTSTGAFRVSGGIGASGNIWANNLRSTDGTIQTVVSYSGSSGVVGTVTNHDLSFFSNGVNRGGFSAAGVFSTVGNTTIGGTLGVTGAQTNSSSIAATRVTMNNSTQTQGEFWGWSNIQGASINTGEIRIGGTEALQGRILYSSAGNTALYIENTFNDANAEIKFRTRVAGSAATPLTLTSNTASITGTLGVTGAITASSLAGTGDRVVVANSSGVLSASQIVTSGTYTPTVSNTTNVASSTASPTYYTRIGDMVTVTGELLVSNTAVANSGLSLSLPIASNFSNIYECTGVGTYNTNVSGGGFYSLQIRADLVNDLAYFTFKPAQNANSERLTFTFTYKVL